MKRIIPIMIVVISLLLSNQSFAQDYNNPGQYMDAISKQQENVSKKYMAYTSASAHGKREKKVEKLRNKLLEEIEEARTNIFALPTFKGDKSYRDTAVSFMKLYYSVMNEDYAKIINMEEIAEQSYDEMEAYLLLQEKVDAKLKESNNRMQEAQKQFALKNNVNLIDSKSELGEMMKESAEVSKYYHEIYLIFFKPFIQEKNMLAAVAKVNLTGMEQNKSSMVKFAQEGLVKLATMKGYKGDNALITACKNMLNFYIKESEKSNSINDFFLTKEKFETLRKVMDKKGSSASKEEVEGYNKAVAEINKASQNYNNTNNELNNLRTENLNNWNNSTNAFFDEHTPKYK